MQIVPRWISAAFCCSCQSFLAVFALFVATPLVLELRAEVNPEYYAVEASATVQTSPVQITLNWAPDWNAAGYTISRKAKDAASWTQFQALGGMATGFTDISVVEGASY